MACAGFAQVLDTALQDGAVDNGPDLRSSGGRFRRDLRRRSKQVPGCRVERALAEQRLEAVRVRYLPDEMAE